MRIALLLHRSDGIPKGGGGIISGGDDGDVQNFPID
jgi:hypothetical protein